MKRKLVIYLCALLFLSGCELDSRYVDVRAYYHAYMAQMAMMLKQPEAAQDHIFEALETESDSYQLHSTLGIIFNQLKKNEDAEKSFREAFKIVEKKYTDVEKFKINFNLGVLFGAQKNIPQALKFYQAALEIDPTSKIVKTNIELLFQQDQNQKGDGEGEDKNQQDGKDGDSQKNKDENDEKKRKEQEEKDRKTSSKYKPRPYQGEQLSEGDVKKILGELAQQDQKIRSNYNKKERKEDRNGKDW